MPNQIYRGHCVNVESDERLGAGVHRIEIFSASSGTLLHAEFASVPESNSSANANDACFQWAREWIEQHPKVWPFSTRQEH
jgi:hypothetical protein